MRQKEAGGKVSPPRKGVGAGQTNYGLATHKKTGLKDGPVG